MAVAQPYRGYGGIPANPESPLPTMLGLFTPLLIILAIVAVAVSVAESKRKEALMRTDREHIARMQELLSGDYPPNTIFEYRDGNLALVLTHDRNARMVTVEMTDGKVNMLVYRSSERVPYSIVRIIRPSDLMYIAKLQQVRDRQRHR